MAKKKEELFVGDVVNIKSSLFANMHWIHLPEEMIILEIIDRTEEQNASPFTVVALDDKNKWILAKINGTYSDSEGNPHNEILLENLSLDKKATRNLTIDQLLDPDISDESDPQ